jgi:hypothetical protein
VDELAHELGELAVKLPPAEPLSLPESEPSQPAQSERELGAATTLLASSAPPAPVASPIRQALVTGVLAGLGVALLITLVTLIVVLPRLL